MCRSKTLNGTLLKGILGMQENQWFPTFCGRHNPKLDVATIYPSLLVVYFNSFTFTTVDNYINNLSNFGTLQSLHLSPGSSGTPGWESLAYTQCAL